GNGSEEYKSTKRTATLDQIWTSKKARHGFSPVEDVHGRFRSSADPSCKDGSDACLVGGNFQKAGRVPTADVVSRSIAYGGSDGCFGRDISSRPPPSSSPSSSGNCAHTGISNGLGARQGDGSCRVTTAPAEKMVKPSEAVKPAEGTGSRLWQFKSVGTSGEQIAKGGARALRSSSGVDVQSDVAVLGKRRSESERMLREKEGNRLEALYRDRNGLIGQTTCPWVVDRSSSDRDRDVAALARDKGTIVEGWRGRNAQEGGSNDRSLGGGGCGGRGQPTERSPEEWNKNRSKTAPLGPG
ncbi:hypothetical protein CBR_g80187, partial [Chara braunii]